MVALTSLTGATATVTAARAGASVTGVYQQVNQVSDIPGVARVTDPNLVNPWGMSEPSANGGGPVWVSNNNHNNARLYTGDQGTPPGPFSPVPLVVNIPGGAPTGQVFNPTADFVVKAGNKSGPARFIFASENGAITGWDPTLPPFEKPTGLSRDAKTAVPVSNSVYKGLAIGANSNGNVLFASNFRTGQIDEFNATFQMIAHPGLFEDRRMPHNYAPFDVAVFGTSLFVTYAKQDALKHDDVKGPGNGYLDRYSLDGALEQRMVTRGPLDSPWGMVMAPAGFGGFAGDLLVGNFGNGRINAFDPATGAFMGTMTNPDGQTIVINGLWGLIFGDATVANPQTLIFSAGIADESHGLLGTLTAVA